MKDNSKNEVKYLLAYVKAKLEKLNNMPADFESLFEVMFSESQNIMFEKSESYRIVKTTYGESKIRIKKKANALKSIIGAEHNSVVGIYMDNSLDWIECFWSVMMAGYCPVLLNIRLGDSIINDVLDRLNAVAVISDNKRFNVKTLLASEVVEAESEIENAKFGTELYFMSSGTSDKVKICAYQSQAFIEQLNNSYIIFQKCPKIAGRCEGELKLLTFLPFYHIFGFVAVYIWFGFFSTTFVELKDFMPNTILNTIKRHKVTHIFSVPLFWDKVYETAIKRIEATPSKDKFYFALDKVDKLNSKPALANAFKELAFREVRENLFGESVRFMISGGSQIKSETIRFFNNIGYHLVNGFGMTEIGITSVELSTNKTLINSRTIGKPLSSVEYKISDDGELLVRGNTLASYIIDGENKIHLDDWFNTNDLAIEKDGQYYIIGRKDDLVISSNGENLNPNLIEAELNTIDNVRLTCFFNNNSKSTLIVSVEKYISDEAFDLIKSELKNKLRDLKLDGQIEEIFYTISPLISGDDIKFNRRKIAKRFNANELEEFRCNKAQDVIDDDIFKTVVSIFAQALNKSIDEIGSDYDFFIDGGGTSLDFSYALSLLDDEFSVPPPVENERNITTVAGIYKYIGEYLNK